MGSRSSSENSTNVETDNCQYSVQSKTKKAPAPQPPKDREEEKKESQCADNLIRATADKLAWFQSSPRKEYRTKNWPVMTGSSPTSPNPQKKSFNGKSEEWILEDGQLKSLRESKQSLCDENEQKTSKIPLSPRPWYKRTNLKEEIKSKDKKVSKKEKSPVNLPEIHTSRETIKLSDNLEESHLFGRKMSKESFSEFSTKSPKCFL